MTIPTEFRKQLIRLEGTVATKRNDRENAAPRARLRVLGAAFRLLSAEEMDTLQAWLAHLEATDPKACSNGFTFQLLRLYNPAVYTKLEAAVERVESELRQGNRSSRTLPGKEDEKK